VSERDTHDDDFRDWPSAAWRGDPDEAPSRREERELYAGGDEESPSTSASAPADDRRLIAPAELKEEPEPQYEPDDAEAEALDISAEHHDDEPWTNAEAEPEPETKPEAEQPSEPEAEVEVADDAAPVPVLEHVGGELDIPPGYTVLEGEPGGHRRAVGIVVSRFNGGITNRMLEAALDALAEAGVAPEAVTVMPVPGAFELPLAAMALAKTRRYACIVALGAVIRGDTPHFDFVATEAASGLQLAQIETGVPVAFGVLTCDDRAQAEARIHKSREAVESALEMADVFEKLRASAKTG
jgi:6,7-dimethyl-8-ribityllumazine synthase